MMDNSCSKETFNKWKKIFQDIETDSIPFDFIEKVEIYFNNGDPPDHIDVSQMLDYNDSGIVEMVVMDEINSLQDVLEGVDFHINFEKAVNIIETATNKSLGKL